LDISAAYPDWDPRSLPRDGLDVSQEDILRQDVCRRSGQQEAKTLQQTDLQPIVCQDGRVRVRIRNVRVFVNDPMVRRYLRKKNLRTCVLKDLLKQNVSDPTQVSNMPFSP
jgi:hypothetical protein